MRKLVSLVFSSVLGFVSPLLDAQIVDIKQDELDAHLKRGAILVDVRTAQEYQQGHIPGAVNLPLNSITGDNHLSDILSEKPIVLYCRSGYRAGKAAKLLKDLLPNHDIKHLDGDFLAWQKAGLPIERSTD